MGRICLLFPVGPSYTCPSSLWCLECKAAPFWAQPPTGTERPQKEPPSSAGIPVSGKQVRVQGRKHLWGLPPHSLSL